MYQFRFHNLDEIDLVTAFITGFYNCTNHKKFMKNEDMAEIHENAEHGINELFMNLGKVTTEEAMLERKRECKWRWFKLCSG